MPKYTCPCCGYIVFNEPTGSYEICPICYWEDDPVQAADPWFAGGANRPNLVDAQALFARYGAMEERFVTDVRPPLDSDRVDPSWRAVLDTDKAYATTPREIEQIPVDDPSRVSYCYWLRTDA